MSTKWFECGDSIIPKTGAFIKLLKPDFKDKFCDNCFGVPSEASLLTCSGCGLMKYCNRQCQRRDWKEAHKMECKSTQFKTILKQGFYPFDSEAVNWTRTILRILSKYHLHPSAFIEKLLLHDGTSRSFMDMMDHVELIESTFSLCILADVLTALLKKDSSFGVVDFDAAFIKKLMGIWNINIFQLYNSDMNLAIGGGLFILHSAIDHSCRPNAFAQRHDNGNLEIRCIHPITKGEKVLISYLNGDGFLNLAKRQSKLLKDYNFKCQCDVCLIEESAGALINYDAQILKLGKELREFTRFQDIVNARDRFVNLAKKVYHEQDERIIRVRKYMHYQLVYNEFRKPMNFLKKETTELLNSILITHGKDSFEHREFLHTYHIE